MIPFKRIIKKLALSEEAQKKLTTASKVSSLIHVNTAQFNPNMYEEDTTTALEDFYPIKYYVQNNKPIVSSTILIANNKKKTFPLRSVLRVPDTDILYTDNLEVMGHKKLYTFATKSTIKAKFETVIRNNKVVWLYV